MLNSSPQFFGAVTRPLVHASLHTRRKLFALSEQRFHLSSDARSLKHSIDFAKCGDFHRFRIAFRHHLSWSLSAGVGERLFHALESGSNLWFTCLNARFELWEVGADGGSVFLQLNKKELL